MTVNYPEILTLEKEGFLNFFDSQIDHGQSAVHLFISRLARERESKIKFIIKLKLLHHENYKLLLN